MACARQWIAGLSRWRKMILIFRRTVFLALFMVPVFLCACNAEDHDQRHQIRNDIKILSKLIHLPKQPEKVWWQTETMGKPGGLGPDDWCLIALMTFKRDDLEAIIRQSKTIPGDLAIPSSHVFAWFPEELSKRMRLCSDGSYVIEESAFDPALFVRSPLLHGYMLKIDNNKILLFLGTL